MDIIVALVVIAVGPFLGMGTTYMMNPEEFKDGDWIEAYSTHFWPWNWAFLALLGLGMLGVAAHDKLAARRNAN